MSRPEIHTADHPDLCENPHTPVGVWNYCAACRDRVCLECQRPDGVSGGGSWMSGHCFDCQGPVIRRQEDLARARKAAERREDLARAWDEGWKHCYQGMTQDFGHGPSSNNPYRSHPVETADLLAGLDADQQEHAPQRAVLDAGAGR